MIEVSFVVVKVVVKVISLFLVALEHSFGTTVLFDPVQNLVQYIDCVARWCVVHRTVVGVGLVSKHCWCARKTGVNFRNQIFADDNKCNTGWSQVLLSTCKKQTKLCNIKWFAQNAGRNISYQRNIACIRNVLVVSSHNCIVKTDVSVIVVTCDFFYFRNVRIVLVLAACNNVYINSKVLSFGSSLFSPYTGFDISSFFVLNTKILSDHGKLSGTTTLNKKYLVVVRYIHKLTNHCFCILDDWLIIL